MQNDVIYLDHQATTPVAQEVLDAMLPLFSLHYSNAGSATHEPGRSVAETVARACGQIASLIGAAEDEVVFTSGATESNNLALLGACLHPRQKRRKIVSVTTEHRAVLDPLKKLGKQGFLVEYAGVGRAGNENVGRVDLDQLASRIDDDTAVVSVMLANNEIGVIQPLREISQICQQRGVLLHTDAAQAVGKIPVDVDALGVDLMSFSAHKCYGPKGVGGLFVRGRGRRVRLAPQIVGGGQQGNLRSGTLNTPGIVAMAAAMQLCANDNAWHENVEDTQPLWLKIQRQTIALWNRLQQNIPGIELNGPSLPDDSNVGNLLSCGEPGTRLPGNLNCSFMPVEGQSLMLAVPRLAVSSGSACTSAEPDVSHVLTAIGLNEDAARSSLRLGLGRNTTDSELLEAADLLAEAAEKLRRLV